MKNETNAIGIDSNTSNEVNMDKQLIKMAYRLGFAQGRQDLEEKRAININPVSLVTKAKHYPGRFFQLFLGGDSKLRGMDYLRKVQGMSDKTFNELMSTVPDKISKANKDIYEWILAHGGGYNVASSPQAVTTLGRTGFLKNMLKNPDNPLAQELAKVTLARTSAAIPAAAVAWKMYSGNNKPPYPQYPMPPFPYYG